MAPAPTELANTVGWFILEGYPWWPVFVCDQYKLRPSLYHLGDGHKRILKKARDFPKDYAIVCYFGSSEFSLVSLKKGVLKPWDCDSREQFLKGHPKHLMKKGTNADDLVDAIRAAEDYLSQPEDTRLPPNMVPSDLDPTLEPPPPMERPPVEEDDEEEEDADGDEQMASEPEAGDDDDDGDAEDAEDTEDNSDDDGGKKKKKSKAKKPKTEKKTKVENKKKREKTEKVPKEKKTPTKEKKESVAKKKNNNDSASESKGKLKRQRSTSSANGAEEKSKQVKKEKNSDVKIAAASEQKEDPPTEDLSAILEKEMQWIINNYQYEEMTTKMVRKLLEERLKRDLRQHRETIKAVVYRVIDSIEGEEDNGGVADAPMEDAESGIKKEEVADFTETKVEEPTPEPMEVAENKNVEEENKVKEEPASAPAPPQAEVDIKKLIEAKTELSLAGNDDKKMGNVLSSLKKLTTVDKKQLVDSGLLPKLVELRSHRKPSVSGGVGELATLWKMEDEIPPPKPVEVEDILKLKEKLEVAETSHDDLLSTLQELEQMTLDLSHLKDTGIARTVAKLRQHANDKVSITAKNLRNAWMQLADKDKQPDNLKTLVQMNQVLESDSESVQAKLTVLKKLLRMSLTTQEIIDSKIGLVVSKLRKSPDTDVVSAANKLRKKWKGEANSA